MKCSTTLFVCDVCGRRRIDGALVPEGWSETSYGFELLCGSCVAAISRFVDDRRGMTVSVPVEDPAVDQIEVPKGPAE